MLEGISTGWNEVSALLFPQFERDAAEVDAGGGGEFWCVQFEEGAAFRKVDVSHGPALERFELGLRFWARQGVLVGVEGRIPCVLEDIDQPTV